MDSAQARDILGLGSAPLSAPAIRQARNDALKAHHPDLAGDGPAANRRATYWAAQINAAYEFLTGELRGEGRTSPTSEPARQSFAAAARRAEARAEREQEAEREHAAAEEAEALVRAAADRAAAERAAVAERAATERRAAERHAAERAASETASVVEDPGAGSTPTPQQSTTRSRGHGLRSQRRTVAAIVVILVVGSTGGTLAALNRLAGPSSAAARVEPSATPPPLPTVVPTPAATPRAASVTFDYWAAMYAQSILPCYSGGACALDAAIAYTDGTTAKFGPEVERLAVLYRDSSKLAFGSDEMCRPEFGSGYALFASLSSEVDLLRQLRKGEHTSDAWRPGQDVSFEGCDRPMNRATAEGDLGQLLTQVRDQLLRAKHDVASKDWHDARLVGDRLLPLGIRIARLTVRDDPGLASPEWGPDRILGWDLIRLSGALGVERLAASSATRNLLTRCLDEIDASPVRPA